MGGDGLYHEVTNGFARRMAAEAGQDLNNPHYEPPELAVPLGLIPCGESFLLLHYFFKQIGPCSCSPVYNNF